MNKLTEREKELVAIGASIGSNCVPCIAYHVGRAKDVGLTEAQISAAIELSEEVRRVPANLVINTAMAYLSLETDTKADLNNCCPPKCGC